jgi:hypothetical protein
MIGPYQTEPVVMVKPGIPGDYMEPTEPELIDLPARVNHETLMVRNAAGEMVASNINILVEVDEDIYFDYRFKINDVEYSIINIDKKQDFSFRYYQIYLK